MNLCVCIIFVVFSTLFREMTFESPSILNDEEPITQTNHQAAGVLGNKRGTTFTVPQSDKIQISFSSQDAPLGETSIHMDLLSLYRDVLQEVIHMDKVKQIVRNLVKHLEGYDNLVSRVDKLENSHSDLDIERLDQSVDYTTHNTMEGNNDNNAINKWLDELDFDNTDSIYGQMPVSDQHGNFVPPGNVFQSPSELKEEMRLLKYKQTTQEREINDLRYSLQQEKLNVETLTENQRLQTTEYEEARTVLIEQSTLLEEQALQLDVMQSTVSIQDAKINQLVLQLQWKTGSAVDFADGVVKSRNLTEELALIETSLNKLSGDVNMLSDRLGETIGTIGDNSGEMRWLKIKVHNIRENMKKLLLLLTGFPDGTAMTPVLSLNQTAVRNILHSMDTTKSADEVEDSTTALFNITRELNATLRTLVGNDNKQKKQLSGLKLDVSSLRDEMDDCWDQLQRLQVDFNGFRDASTDHVRDRDVMKKRLNRMMKEIKDLYDVVETPSISSRPKDETHKPTHESNPLIKQNQQHPITEALIGDPSVTQTAMSSTANKPHQPHNPVKHPAPEIIKPFSENSGSTFNNCRLAAIRTPKVIKVFERGLTGAWMRDCSPKSDKHIVYAMMSNDKIRVVREYESAEQLFNRTRMYTAHRLPFRCTGTGHVVLDGYLYCNKFGTNRLVKYHLASQQEAVSRSLEGAGFSNTFAYASVGMTDIDLSVDEHGLWAIYSPIGSDGNMTVSRLDPDTLEVIETWLTDFPKTVANNAFMACGRLYATVIEHNHRTRVAYIYDTITKKSAPNGQKQKRWVYGKDALTFPELPEHMQMMSSLQYNPVDKKLYAWNLSSSWNGHLTSYQCVIEEE